MKIRTLRLSAFALVSCFWLCAQNTVSLPAPYATPSVYRFPKVVAKPDGAELNLPAGFQIEEFATGFRLPRFMTLGPGGEILVTDSLPSGKGSVYLIGATERKPIVTNLDKPYGMAFWGNYLYVAEPESIKRYPYD